MPILSPLLRGLASLLLLPALAAQRPTPASLAQVLQASRWQQRVLLIGAPTVSQAEFQQQKKLLANAATGLADRDFRVLEVPFDQLPPADRQYWQHALGQSLSHFAVVLIGKDGGVKRVETQPLASASLFATVDGMPMRRQEMRTKK